MAEITAQLVKQLREKTNAGMMDCQKALKETGGDLELAEEWLRKKGITRGGGRGGREAKEGVIHAIIADGGKTGVLLEFNSETDFVAKNENFRGFVNNVGQQIVAAASADDNSVENFVKLPSSDGKGTVDEQIKAKIGEIGENLVLRRFRRFSAGANSIVSQYIHMAGRIGVLIEVATEKPETREKESFKTLVKDLTLHIAASTPEFLKRNEVPTEVRAKEEEIQRERMKDQLEKKPENIQQKIIEGSLGKFYAQICLLEQAFVKNPEQSVDDLLKASTKELGDTVTIVRFARFAVGEEIKA